MREGCLAHTRDVFEQQLSSGQETDDRHLDDVRFSLNHAGNIVLNGLKRAGDVHRGLSALVATKWMMA
jgi:hypothetical protein